MSTTGDDAALDPPSMLFAFTEEDDEDAALDPLDYILLEFGREVLTAYEVAEFLEIEEWRLLERVREAKEESLRAGEVWRLERGEDADHFFVGDNDDLFLSGTSDDDWHKD